MKFYCFHEYEKHREPIITNSLYDARYYNQDGYGIYYAVNEFYKGRKESDVKKLRYLYADFDCGDKESQLKKLKQMPNPTRVIESKAGFHVYWKLKDDIIYKYGKDKAIKYYKKALNILVNQLGADTSVKDVTRVLRYTGFDHLKNPLDPFRIRTVYRSNNEYSFKDLIYFLKEKQINKIEKSNQIKASGETFKSKIYQYRQDELLIRLSNKPELNNENFTIEKNQIYVDGERTANWIDESGYIGTKSGEGGPTIIEWVHWYVKDANYKQTYAIILKYLPEIGD